MNDEAYQDFGLGFEPDDNDLVNCDECKGKGYYVSKTGCHYCFGSGCASCEFTGQLVITPKCKKCNGVGLMRYGSRNEE